MKFIIIISKFKMQNADFKFQISNFKNVIFIAILAAGLVCGCAHKPPQPQSAKPLNQAEVDAQIKNKTIADPFLRTQVDFGLEARRSASNRIQATVRNKTAGEVLVGPICFAVILPSAKKTVKPTPDSLKLFPITKATPGQEVSGELTFPIDPIPADARLVFHHPDGQPAMAPIR